jgi:hypothetical protein
MKTEEMVQILEEIIRDPKTNPTARCTGIRRLREIQETASPRTDVDEELETVLYLDAPRRSTRSSPSMTPPAPRCNGGRRD